LRDAQSQKEDSHMFKHWKTAHPDLPEAPVFTIKVVASFQDALSRQLSGRWMSRKMPRMRRKEKH
jgi:hypothetical protein